MIRWAVGACIAVAVLSGCGTAASRKAGYTAEGQKYFAAGRYDKARVEFGNAAQIDPKDATVRYWLGRVAEKNGDLRVAATQYRSAVNNDPNLVAARAALARLYLYARLPQAVMELIAPGLAAYPKNPELLTARGAARQQLGDSEGALQDAQLAVQLAPTDDYAVALLASLYRSRGQFDQAISVVQAGLQRLPDNIDLLVILADLSLQAKRPQDAAATLRRVVALAPGDLTQRYRLASFYLSQKQLDSAEQTLREAVAVAPGDLGAKQQLLAFLMTQRGRAPVVAEVDRMVQQQPHSDDLRNLVGEVLFRAGMSAEAETQFRAVIAHAGSRPAGLVARDQLATLMLSRADTGSAASLVAQVLRENPRDNGALIVRSELSMRSGNLSDAIADLRAVLRDQPNSIALMRSLAQAYARNGQPDLAEVALRNAVRLSPQDTDANLQLANLLLTANKPDQAADLLKPLAQGLPQNLSVQEALFRAQAAQRQIADARATAVSIQKLSPDRALGYYLEGLVDETDNKLDDAQRAYQLALKVEPDAADPLASLVQIYARRKHPELGMQAIDLEIAHSPHNAFARELRGSLLLAQGQVEPAISAYREAVTAAPQWAGAYHALALGQMRGKHVDDAVATLQDGIAKATDPNALVNDLASLYLGQSRMDDAMALYNGILVKNPNSIFAANNLALLLVKYKTDASSLSRAQKLADQLAVSSLANIIDTRGWVKFKSGDYHAAESLLQQAVDKSPNAPEFRYHLAMAQLRSGETGGAQQNLETALGQARPFDGINDARTTLARLKKTPAG